MKPTTGFFMCFFTYSAAVSSALPPISPIMITASVCRSEERRVGKECRSRCDWSSDVCSSDLDEADHRFLHVLLHVLGSRLFRVAANLADHDHGLGLQIGRASCRERV